MPQFAPPLEGDRRTVYHLLCQAVESFGSLPALKQPLGKGEYQTYSWIDYRRAVEEIAAGLRSLGIGIGDIVGLASETRAEFYTADCGVMVNGAIAAAVYTSLAPAEQVRTLKNCDPKAIFVENPRAMRVLKAAGGSALDVQWILMEGEDGDTLTLEKLREMGTRAMLEDPWLLEKFRTEIKPDLHCILYLTSGATGEPKMGLVTHRAVLAVCDMGPQVLPLGPGDETLAFLPSAHITQRAVLQYLMIRQGVCVWFSEGLARMPKELQAIKPTFFVAPPRVWERIYASVTTEIRKKPAPVRKLFYMGIGVGSEAARKRQAGKEPAPWISASLKFFDKVVFSKIRERLGGRLKVAGSGAAPLGKALAEFYAAIGLPLVEGYGLTEGGIVTLNPVDRPKAGSIGKPLPGVEVKIGDDGELLLRSEAVFTGYYKDPAATEAVLRDGWLHTGDVAEIDGDGYLWITGRKKELIVSSNGKKIYPARIEGLFKMEPLVNQVLLIGDKLPYMTALVTLNPAAAGTVGGLEPGVSNSLPDLAKSGAVAAEVKKVIDRVNKHLAPFEKIRRFKILERDFSLETGELTPTMKLRRGKVFENFKKEISDLYVGREDF